MITSPPAAPDGRHRPGEIRPHRTRDGRSPRGLRRALGLLALLTLVPSLAPAKAQGPTLQLRDVLSAVEAHGFGARAARADARAADANVTATLPAFLPQLRVEGGSVRTTDPIGVFGAKLRQRVVTQADFDPAILNRPDALSITTGALVLEQPVFAPQALLGRRAASLAAQATHAMTERQVATAQLDATRGYYGAVVASASVAALDSAVAAATAHVAQAATLERNGVVTHSDVLLAQVRLGELQAQRASATGQALMARLALAVQMGQPADTARALPLVLPSSATLAALATGASALNVGSPDLGAPDVGMSDVSMQNRSDVRAARLGAQAARADVRRATARWLPTVGVMLRSDWAAVNQPFAGSPYWTAGLMVTVPVFSGGGDLADRQRAVAISGAAEARAEGAAAMASLEAAEARIQRTVALERMAIADRALEQSREALRLVQRRYDGGLAAITELLDAGAARSAAELSSLTARHDVLVAIAAERIALGLDFTPLLALDR